MTALTVTDFILPSFPVSALIWSGTPSRTTEITLTPRSL